MTAEEYLLKCLTPLLNRIEESYNAIEQMKKTPEWDATLKAIEEAQKDAYNQALEDAAKNVKVSLFNWIYDGFIEIKQNAQHYSINDGAYVKIDKESIFKLKK